MSLLKRVSVVVVAVIALTLSCVLLIGCGEPVAATYDGGKVTEEEVTQAIETMRTYYGLADDEEWDKFVTERAYNTEGSTSSMTAVEKAAAQAPNAKTDDEDLGPGTLEDMRAYVIEQIIRSQLIDREIKNRNYKISDEEVDLYVEQQRTYVESMIMEGVFESVIQRQGYKDLNAYKDAIREQLKQLKLQNEVSALAEEDGQEVSGKAAWSIWFEKLYADAHVKINPAPEGLVYNVIEVESEEGAGQGN